MKKFRITASTYAHIHLGEFEAETKDEAMDMADEALNNVSTSLCHQCGLEIELNDFDIRDENVDELKSPDVQGER